MKDLLCVGLLLTCIGLQAQNATAHAPDGGVKQTLQSIVIFPLTGAPFSAMVTTEWTHFLPDGTKATVKNRRFIARDSAGRIFEERRYFSPTGDKQPTVISNLQFIDPNRHEMVDCHPGEKSCYVEPYYRVAMAKMPDGVGGSQVCGCATARMPGMTVKQEALGAKSIEDVETIGSREITTLPAGTMGMEQPEPIVKEFWYSPRLGVNLVVKRFDPRSGMQNFEVNEISLSEPDPKLFLPPATYDVVRMVRQAGARPSGQTE